MLTNIESSHHTVGYFNYRYFVNFLIYIFVGMAYGTAIMLEPFLLAKSPDYRKQLALHRAAEQKGIATIERLVPMMPLRHEKMTLTLSFMLCTAVGIAVALLGGFHIYLTLTGQTTIEFHGNWAKRKRARAAGQKWKNPYSRGSWRLNWQQVYGSTSTTTTRGMLLALLPSRRDPEFLPVPVPGHDGRRLRNMAANGSGDAVSKDEDDSSNNIPCGNLTADKSERERLVRSNEANIV